MSTSTSSRVSVQPPVDLRTFLSSCGYSCARSDSYLTTYPSTMDRVYRSVLGPVSFSLRATVPSTSEAKVRDLTQTILDDRLLPHHLLMQCVTAMAPDCTTLAREWMARVGMSLPRDRSSPTDYHGRRLTGEYFVFGKGVAFEWPTAQILVGLHQIFGTTPCVIGPYSYHVHGG